MMEKYLFYLSDAHRPPLRFENRKVSLKLKVTHDLGSVFQTCLMKSTISASLVRVFRRHTNGKSLELDQKYFPYLF